MFSQCQPLKHVNKRTKQTKTQINLIIYINSHKFLSNLVKLHQTNSVYVKPYESRATPKHDTTNRSG